MVNTFQREKRALPSFTSNALQSGKLTPDEKYALKFCAAALYGGGLDTVTGVSLLFEKDLNKWI